MLPRGELSPSWPAPPLCPQGCSLSPTSYPAWAAPRPPVPSCQANPTAPSWSPTLSPSAQGRQPPPRGIQGHRGHVGPMGQEDPQTVAPVDSGTHGPQGPTENSTHRPWGPIPKGCGHPWAAAPPDTHQHTAGAGCHPPDPGTWGKEVRAPQGLHVAGGPRTRVPNWVPTMHPWHESVKKAGGVLRKKKILSWTELNSAGGGSAAPRSIAHPWVLGVPWVGAGVRVAQVALHEGNFGVS